MLLGSYHAAFEHNKVIGHFITVDKATQGVDILVRHIIISRGIVLDQFALLDEVSLVNIVDLLVDLVVVMVACTRYSAGPLLISMVFTALSEVGSVPYLLE